MDVERKKVTYKHLTPARLRFPVAFVRSCKSDENDQREGIKRFAVERKLEIVRWENENCPDSPHITGHKTLKHLWIRMDREGECSLLIESWQQVSQHEKVRAQLLELALRRGIIVTCADGRSTYASYKKRLETTFLEELENEDRRISKQAFYPEHSHSWDLPFGQKVSPTGQMTKSECKQALLLRIKQLRAQRKTLHEIHRILVEEGHLSFTGKPLKIGVVSLLAAKVAPVGYGHPGRAHT